MGINQQVKQWFMMAPLVLSETMYTEDDEPRTKEAKTEAEKRSLNKSLKNRKKKKLASLSKKKNNR